MSASDERPSGLEDLARQAARGDHAEPMTWVARLVSLAAVQANLSKQVQALEELGLPWETVIEILRRTGSEVPMLSEFKEINAERIGQLYEAALYHSILFTDALREAVAEATTGSMPEEESSLGPRPQRSMRIDELKVDPRYQRPPQEES